MKKLFLLLLPGMMFLAGEAEAQFAKGTKHWGATVSFSGNTQVYKADAGVEAKLGNQNLSPAIQFGKFYKDNTMFGLRFTPFFSFNKQTQDGWGNDYDIRNNFMSLTLSPFIRRYKSISPKWAIFLQPGLNLSYLRGTSKGIDEKKDHSDGFGAGAYILPGIVFRVTPRFALEADANVLSLNLNYSNLDSVNSFGFNAGFTSNIQQYFSIRASWYLTTSN